MPIKNQISPTHRTTIPLLTYFLFAGFYINAQQAEFNDLFDQLKNTIVEVESGKYKYDQQVLFIDHGVIKYGYTKTSEKGSTQFFEYELNIADIDPYVVREYTSKDLIMVNIKIRNSQKLIKIYEENEVKTYTNEMAIVALNIDNAREIRKILEDAIPIAEQIVKKKLSLEGYSQMINWLAENVRDASTNEKIYRQMLKKDEAFPGKMIFTTIINTGKSSSQNKYEFNLADINVNSISFKITGDQFALEFETVRKNNLIKFTKDGVAKPFVNDILIRTNNVEQAQDLRNVLNMIIPLAEQEVENSYPQMKAENEALTVVKRYINNITYGTTTFEQSLSDNCLASVRVMEITEKSNTPKEYIFNMIDINENVLDYETTSNKMFLGLTVNDKQKLIKVTQNGEEQNYDGNFRVFCEDVEVARRLKIGLKALIGICKKNYKPLVPQSSKTDRVQWLTKNVVEVKSETKTHNQILEQVPSDRNEIILKFTRYEKVNNEYIYEFNVADLNPKSIKFDIKGKTVLIKASTNFNEKIIKSYKNGEINNYKGGLGIYATDVESARNIIMALVQLIDDQK